MGVEAVTNRIVDFADHHTVLTGWAGLLVRVAVLGTVVVSAPGIQSSIFKQPEAKAPIPIQVLPEFTFSRDGFNLTFYTDNSLSIVNQAGHFEHEEKVDRLYIDLARECQISTFMSVYTGGTPVGSTELKISNAGLSPDCIVRLIQAG